MPSLNDMIRRYETSSCDNLDLQVLFGLSVRAVVRSVRYLPHSKKDKKLFPDGR